jgi:hypothetical protein
MSQDHTIRTALLAYIRCRIASPTDAARILSQYVGENREYIEWVLDRPLQHKFAHYQVSCLTLDRMILDHLAPKGVNNGDNC